MKSFKTRVIQGEGRGSKIGFPTINLDYKDLKIDYGIYIAELKIDSKKYFCLIHFGPKKTFSNTVSLEIFLKEQIDNVFKKEISLKFLEKIREIIKFSDINELKKQLNKDLKYLEQYVRIHKKI